MPVAAEMRSPRTWRRPGNGQASSSDGLTASNRELTVYCVKRAVSPAPARASQPAIRLCSQS